MKEVLELKHLAPYLPYEVKFISNMGKPFGEYGKQPILTMGGITTLFIITKKDINAYAITTCKLILRPLSDLTKEIEHNKISRAWCNKDDKVTPSELLKRCSLLSIREDGHFSEDNGDGTCTGYLYGGASYSTIELLLSWHFDVFGLIKKGLAIDINTLKS